MAVSSNPEDRFILETFDQLSEGDRRAVRRWGDRFSAFVPGRYEPWLILGLLSDPPLSIYSMKRALQLNPKSGQARAGLRWETKRLKGTAAANSIPPSQKPLAFPPSPRRPRKSIPFGGFGFLLAALLLAVGCGALGIAWRVRAADNRAAAMPAMTPTPFQPVSPTPRPTETPTAIQTFEPTAAAALPPLPSVTAPSISPQSSDAKSIVVSLSQQQLSAYAGGALVYRFTVSTGQNGGTATGNFEILDKIYDAYSLPWGFWMPDWMGIYYPTPDMEDGIHALPVLLDGETIWGNDLGTPVSYGCIVLGSDDAGWLFQWAEIGTPVSIQE